MFLIPVIKDQRVFGFIDKQKICKPWVTKSCFFETFSEANSIRFSLKKQDIDLHNASKVVSGKELVVHIVTEQLNNAILLLLQEQESDKTNKE